MARNSTQRRKTTARQRFGTQGHAPDPFVESVRRRIVGPKLQPNPWSVHDGCPVSDPPPGFYADHDQALAATRMRPLGVRTGELYPLATLAGGWAV